MARSTCLYCGADLPADSVAEAELAAARAALAGHTTPMVAKRFGLVDAPPPPPSARLLLVVDVTGLEAAVLGHALNLPSYEAGQRQRQGGLHLHRVGPAPEVEAEASRLEGEGIRTVLVPEAEVQVSPVRATGGEQEGRRLWLRAPGGTVELGAEDLLLVVEGPIQREYEPRVAERTSTPFPTARFVTFTIPRLSSRSHSLEAGYRFHLHRRSDPRPLELDPANFTFGSRGAVAGSSLLELKAWVAALGEGVPVDDAFKRLPPALSPTLDEADAATSLRQMGRGFARAQDAPTILDNLAQFHFYSGWRAAAFRRR